MECEWEVIIAKGSHQGAALMRKSPIVSKGIDQICRQLLYDAETSEIDRFLRWSRRRKKSRCGETGAFHDRLSRREVDPFEVENGLEEHLVGESGRDAAGELDEFRGLNPASQERIGGSLASHFVGGVRFDLDNQGSS